MKRVNVVSSSTAASGLLFVVTRPAAQVMHQSPFVAWEKSSSVDERTDSAAPESFHGIVGPRKGFSAARARALPKRPPAPIIQVRTIRCEAYRLDRK